MEWALSNMGAPILFILKKSAILIIETMRGF